jgi:glycosyltransferase involved in cell wall biosynthesis
MTTRAGRGRLLLDVSSLARWTGPPSGMIRVESELLFAAPTLDRETIPVFFDPVKKHFRTLHPRWNELVLGWHGAIDTLGLDYTLHRTGWRRIVPSRLPAVRWLERRRLLARSGIEARLAATIRAALLRASAHQVPVSDREGTSIAMVPHDLVLTEAIEPAPADLLLTAASDWSRKDPAALLDLKRRTGLTIVAVCYDIFPITHPGWFPPDDARMFQAYWDRMFAAVDTVIVNSRAVRRDIQDYLHRRGAAEPSIAVVPLGASPASVVADRPPAGLMPDRYALFVSTIEPRKNHGLLLDVWRRLLDRGIPSRHDFRLVFAGRMGWMVDDVARRLADPTAFNGTVVHLSNLDDNALRALLAGAAFCLYPSYAEGFGLPVVEAFSHGKPVLVSHGGSLAEVAGTIAPVLDPRDIDAWEAAMADWIEHPDQRAAAAERVRALYQPRPWCDVARDMLAVAEAASATAGSR